MVQAGFCSSVFLVLFDCFEGIRNTVVDLCKYLSVIYFTYIDSHTITCHVGVSRTMLCWPLSLEMRKFTQARPDSPEKRTH